MKCYNCLFIILLFTLFLNKSSSLMINKCCPHGSYMNATGLVCTPVNPVREKQIDTYRWFPEHALYNGTTKAKLLLEEQDDLTGKLLVPDNINYGNFTLCANPYFKLFLYRGAEQFHILVDSAEEMMVKATDPSDDTKMTNEYMWTLSMDEVCFDLLRDSFTTVFYCPGKSKPYISKCCPPGAFYNATMDPPKCVPIPEHLNITDWLPHNASQDLTNFFLAVPAGAKFPSCKSHITLKSAERAKRCRGVTQSITKFYFFGNGSVKALDTIISPHEYCGEKTWHSDTEIFEQNIIYCQRGTETAPNVVIYGILFLAGGFCLLVTVGISLLLPELRRRIHNKIAITHNATLMVAHFLWGANQLWPPTEVVMGSIMSLLIQFTFLGSLFWLNAMCINMSSTFRTTQTLNIQSIRSEVRRYCIYSLYAWGFTGLISIFTISMEFSETPLFGLPRPGFSCLYDFARKSFSVFVYFYGPMLILLIFNLVLYIFTTWKIISVQRQTSILHHTDSKTAGGTSFQSDKQRLILYTKLFLLMGLTWVTEIIGWAVGGNNFFWTILDVVNLLRAVFIFVLFICKRPVLRSLRNHIETATGRLRRSGSFSRSMTEAISLSTMGPSRKASQEEGRKRSKDHGESDDKKGKSESRALKSEPEVDIEDLTFEFDKNGKSY